MTNELPFEFNLNQDDINELIGSYECPIQSINLLSSASKNRITNFPHTQTHSQSPLNFEIEGDEMLEFFKTNKIFQHKSKEEEFKGFEVLEKINELIRKYEQPQQKSLIVEKEKKEDSFFEDEEQDKKDIEVVKYLEKKRKLKKKENNYQKLENIETKKKLKKATQNKEMLLPINTTCSICLEQIIDLANPNNCNHDFCKGCLLKWSHCCSNTCPLCKKPFHKIFIYDKNKRIEIKVEKKKQKRNESIVPRDDCYVCGSRINVEDLILCAMCNYNVCHFFCDKLDKVPNGRWFCRTCKEEIKQQRQMRRNIGKRYVQ